MPELLVAQADRVRLPYAPVCVLFQKETGGGQNIYGHDKNACFSFVNPYRNVKVTKQNYAEYLECVKNGGKRNGVGPLQATWHGYQIEADKRGGCWQEEISVGVCLEAFAGHLHATGNLWESFKRYNGKASYADDAMKILPRWAEVTGEKL